MTHPIRIVLVDDQILFVESLRVVIETRAADMRIEGIANDGNQAVELVRRVQPDVVLMDVRMPNLGGVEATRILRKELPAVRILMLTTFDDDDDVFRAMQYGAAGYLMKDIPPSQLLASIRTVYQGQFLFSSVIATRMARRLGHESEEGSSLGDLRAQYRLLSKRERDVFDLVADGFDNHEIAHLLNIAEQTVRNYVSEVYAKTGIPDRVHLIRIAREIGNSLSRPE